LKPPNFDYVAPATVAEVLEHLREHGSDTRLLAGGQSLVPLLNFRLSRPAIIIDLNRVAELAYIREQNGHLAIGAMTRQRAIENADSVERQSPLLHEATKHIGHLPIRSRGTIGGSLANADPAAEDPAVITALGGVMVLNSHRGERRVRSVDFFRGLLTTAIEPDELLCEVEIPAARAGSGWAFEEISRRHGDFALAGTAALVALENGRVVEARLAACGVGPGPVRLAHAEEAIINNEISDDAIEAAAAAAALEVSPSTDVHASASYRRKLTSAMTKRALYRALARARGDHG